MATAAIWELGHPNATESLVAPNAAKFSREYVGDGDPQESIIEPDLRWLVESSDYGDNGKYRSVVKIQARFGDKADGSHVWMMGTGWLIKENLLVTAGHVVYDWSMRLGEAQEIRCYIGYHGRQSIKNDDVQTRSAVRVVTTSEWLEDTMNRDRTKDLAFIQVDRPFTGNLRLFQYTTTPSPATSSFIGVVGYPGDKSLTDSETGQQEAGAQMYEQFKVTDYDLDKSARHMVEYRLSTFGGQSGAPIILRDEKNSRIVIGTHCYGGGTANSGNAIGGTYGNVYENYVSLIEGTTPAKVGEVTIVSMKPGGNPAIPVNPDTGDTESILDVLKAMAKASPTTGSIVGSILGGPIGGALGTIAGTLLSSISGAESAVAVGGPTESLDAERLAPGAAERAVVAEAALQTLVALESSQEYVDLLNDTLDRYKNFSPNIDSLAKHLTPQLTQQVLNITIGSANRTASLTRPPTESAHIPQRRELPGISRAEAFPGRTKGNDFAECLLGPTIPAAGEEEGFALLGTLFTKAVSGLKPLVAMATKTVIEEYAPKLVKTITDKLGGNKDAESLATSAGLLNADAAQLIFKRALLADAALQAFMSRDKATLERLKIQSDIADEHGQGGAMDFLKAAAQKLSPIALGTAKQAVADFGSILLDRAVDKPGGSGKPVAFRDPLGRRPPLKNQGLLDLTKKLNGTSTVEVSSFRALGPSSTSLQASVVTRRLYRQPLWERDLAEDDNEDLPVIMLQSP